MAKKTITLSPGESKSVSFEIVPYEARVHLVSVDGLAGSFIATEVPRAWILPTGHIDPADEWDYEANAYDGNTDTYAENWTPVETWSGPLELTTAPIDISAIRCYISSPLTPKIGDIDVFYDGAYHHVYEGELSTGWNEISIPGGVKAVTKARFRMYNRSYTRRMRFRLHEFQFWGS